MRGLPASLLVVAVLLRADFEASEWRFRKPIDVPGADVCSFAIGRDVFAASRPGLPDLRLIAAGSEVPFVVERTSRAPVADVAPERREDPDARATVLTLDLGIPNQPHSYVRIESPGGYFHRDVEVETSADGKEWAGVARHVLFRLPAGEELDLTYPERDERFFRLRILNRDDRPIAVSRVYVEGFGRRMRFVAQGAGRLWLLYDNPSARAPSYDLARILEQQPRGPGCQASAGVEEANPGYREPAPVKPWTERHPELLYATLIGAVAGLAYILVRFRRQTGAG